jgi:hypothetical protein
MKKGNFTCEIFIKAPHEKVIELATSFEHHDTLHPLIVKVEEIPAEPPVLRRFWITDQLPVGLFRFKIKYRADILKLTPDEAHTEAWQSPGVHIISHMSFTEENGGTLLREEYMVEAPSLLFGYIFKQAKAAHEELLVLIKQAAEAP